MATIEDLPDELLIEIFTYLPIQHRRNVQRVNSHWYKLCRSARVVSKDVLFVNAYEHLDRKNFNGKYPNVSIKDVDHLSRKMKPGSFWKNCGKHVIKLEISGVNFRSFLLKEILTRTPKLKYLVLRLCACEFCEQMIPHKKEDGHFDFPSLLSLNVSEVNGKTLKKLLMNVPRLEQLKVYATKKECCKVLVDFTKRQGKTLKGAHLSVTSMTDETLQLLIENCGPQLVDLSLRECTSLTDESLKLIQKKLPNLEKLDLASTKFSGAEILNLLKSRVHFCKELNLAHCELMWQIAPSTLRFIREMSSLRKLNLTNTKLNPKLLSDVLGKRDLPQLEELNLSGVTFLTSHLFEDIVEHIPNVENLTLDDCPYICDRTLQLLTKWCKKLFTLSIQRSELIHDVSYVNGLKGLQHLCFDGCLRIDSKSVAELSLVDLQTLFLKGCPVLPEDFKTAVSNCPSLMRLCSDRFSRFLGLKLKPTYVHF